MKTREGFQTVPPRGGGLALPAADAESPLRRRRRCPRIIASAFGKLNVEWRARLLGRLLGSVGPMALVVVGGGVFAKYLFNAGWPEIPISIRGRRSRDVEPGA